MVLIYAFMDVLENQTPPPSVTTPVSTVITLASPEDDEHLSTPPEVMSALQDGFSDKGLTMEQVKLDRTFVDIGTRAHRRNGC